MSDNIKKTESLQSIQKNLSLFFPEDSSSFTTQAVVDGIDSGDFIVKNDRMLPYLQTAILDEKIVEVELDGMDRVYFSKVYDDLPDLVEVEDGGELQQEEPDYTIGDYLKLMSHLITLPLEPGMGNLHIRNSKKLIIRFFTSTSTIEFGTFFQDMALVRDIPVLRLDFPVIGRQVRGTRVYRATVPADMAFSLLIAGKRKRPNIKTRPINVSAQGLAFTIKKKQQNLFRIEENCSIQFIMDGTIILKVSCVVRHISRVRGKDGIEYRCGVQFDLVSRSVAAMIETVVAKVQREHLQELFNKSLDSGIDLIR